MHNSTPAHDHKPSIVSQVQQTVQHTLEPPLQTLRGVRDEIRLKMHLASMEAKQTWNEQLEPRVADAEHAVSHATESANATVHELIQKFRNFRDSLTR